MPPRKIMQALKLRVIVGNHAPSDGSVHSIPSEDWFPPQVQLLSVTEHNAISAVHTEA